MPVLSRLRFLLIFLIKVSYVCNSRSRREAYNTYRTAPVVQQSNYEVKTYSSYARPELPPPPPPPPHPYYPLPPPPPQPWWQYEYSAYDSSEPLERTSYQQAPSSYGYGRGSYAQPKSSYNRPPVSTYEQPVPSERTSYQQAPSSYGYGRDSYAQPKSSYNRPPVSTYEQPVTGYNVPYSSVPYQGQIQMPLTPFSDPEQSVSSQWSTQNSPDQGQMRSILEADNVNTSPPSANSESNVAGDDTRLPRTNRDDMPAPPETDGTMTRPPTSFVKPRGMPGLAVD